MTLKDRLQTEYDEAATRVQLNSPGAAAASFIAGRTTDFNAGPYGTAGSIDEQTDAYPGPGGVFTSSVTDEVSEDLFEIPDRVRDSVIPFGKIKLLVYGLIAVVVIGQLGRLFDIGIGQ